MKVNKIICDVCGNEVNHGSCNLSYDFRYEEDSFNGYTKITELKGHKDICWSCLCKMAKSVGIELKADVRRIG